jgi:hypothetical protein
MNTTFTKLDKPLTLKGVPVKDCGFNWLANENDNLPAPGYIRINEWFDDNEFKKRLETATHIVYIKGADDINTRILANGIRVLRSCDTNRAYIALTDGTLYLTDPYYIWDTWLQQENPSIDNLDWSTVTAKGYIKGKRITITHLVFNDNERIH